MQPAKLLRFVAMAMLVAVASPSPCSAQTTLPTLGSPPTAPKNVSGLPGGVSKQSVTGGFSVNTDSREEVRGFYNAIYPSSTGVPINTTADVSTCTPGTNGTAFQEAVLRRINWFRAMAGVPASVTLDPGDNTNDQAAAELMSANTNLSHFPTPSWFCYTSAGANAASNSDLALGFDGADAITAYIWDFGGNNTGVGHRRWILYPQTQVMGTGDVPQQGSFEPANATWVFDANLHGPRPATTKPYIAWPPEGFVPYPVVYPQWSFSLTNAIFTNATVSMKSNGVSVVTVLQTVTNGFGENTLVWVPMGLDATTNTTVFPFGGTDTVYSVTVTNIKVGAATIGFSYNVTVFDPAVPGTDYVATAISGPTQAVANVGNPYACSPANNPHVTGYQWITSQRLPGNLFDGAEGGLVNFTVSPTPIYPVITNSPVFAGTHSFHLTHTNPVPQLMQLNELLFPATNTMVTFESELGYATSDQVARVQASVDGGINWLDIYVQAGTGGAGELSFNLRSLSLSNYAARATLLRFNYDIPTTAGYYPQSDPGVGWALDNIVVTNTEQLVNFATNSTASTNFSYTPAQTGNFNLQAQALIFTQFPLDPGPVKQVTVVPLILLSRPVVTNGQVRLDFTVSPNTTSTFKLRQADQLGAAWITNLSAVFTTNTPGSSYRFTTPVGPAARFYRIQMP